MTIHKGAYVSLEVGMKPKVILKSSNLYCQEHVYRKRGGKKDNRNYHWWLLGQASLTRTAT